MSLRSRLDKLRKAVSPRPPAEPTGPRTHEEWLEGFEAMARAGDLDREPDSPRALTFYRDAVLAAKVADDPPWCPPPEFMRGQDERVRVWAWQNGGEYVHIDSAGNILPEGTDVNRGWSHRAYRFPRVREGWYWLAGMAIRLWDDIPPVTESEFDALKGWLQTNQARIESLSMEKPYMVDLGWGILSLVTLLGEMDRGGGRGVHAGEQAEAVRQLRARWGEALTG